MKYLTAAFLMVVLSVAAAEDSPPDSQSAIVHQTECPVMIGQKINPSLYVDYKGQRIYFCCKFCKNAFEKDPTKYEHRLPAVLGTADGQNHDEYEKHGLSAAGLIEPMGITTLVLVAVTVGLGVFRRRNPALLKWHKRLGPLALLAGVIHAVLVSVAH